MRSILAQVDRIQRLAVLDAAARTGSFTAAAAEIATTQPAVTRQIRELEHALGVPLFHRTANRSELTDAGRKLADAVDAGFARIERGLSELLEPQPTFVLAAPPGLAQLILVPVLDELYEAVGDVDIRLWLYDRDSDLDRGAYDVAIRVGDGSWPGHHDVELFAERVVPVATGQLARRLGLSPYASAEAVLAAPLLHMEAQGRPWASWSEWLNDFGLQLTPGIRRVVLNSYPAVIQQAIAGHGVALGWRGVVDQLLRDSVLEVVGPEVSTARTYRVTWPDDAVDGPAVDEDVRKAAVDWLMTALSSAS